MKKVYLCPVQQYGTVFYIGKYEPTKLVMMSDPSIEIGQVQEAQRPLDRKHLKEISDYTGPNEKGMLPASVLIATKEKERIKIQEDKQPDGEVRYYAEFPETEEELAAYSNTIDIIDGQHRLFAFDKKYRNENWKQNTVYEMAFSMFITPDLQLRRRLFTITNEKQKAVSSNLLLYLKSKLGMLRQDEAMYLPLVNLLNSENESPLKGRIVMSAERITKGYKAKELIKILNKGKVRELKIGTPPQELSLGQTLEALCIYIRGWEEFYSLSYQKPEKETMTKISGLRYIILLFSTFVDHSIHTRSAFTVEFVKDVIQDLENAKGLNEEQTLFDSSLEFRGEGATVKLAVDDAALLKAYLAAKSTEGFNPFA